MLQNRVNPFGEIIRTHARGSLMGNRGVLHNDQQVIRSSFKLKAWITCKLSFKGRKRIVMSPRNYTELFFMDEATSFAAGHRPCFECRREDALKFKSAWLAANPQYGFTGKSKIGEIDKVMHDERVDRSGNKVIHQEDITLLPNGVFIAIGLRPYVVSDGKLYSWIPSGYENEFPFPAEHIVDVLTPRSVVNAFRAGYVPEVHVRQPGAVNVLTGPDPDE